LGSVTIFQEVTLEFCHVKFELWEFIGKSLLVLIRGVREEFLE
jgi:hypothetical protein